MKWGMFPLHCRIATPLHVAKDFIVGMANGTQMELIPEKISDTYLGDYEKLKDSINFIEGQFNQVLAEINSSADQVESGAGQVASASQGLSQGASEQAGSVEQISAVEIDRISRRFIWCASPDTYN